MATIRTRQLGGDVCGKVTVSQIISIFSTHVVDCGGASWSDVFVCRCRRSTMTLTSYDADVDDSDDVCRHDDVVDRDDMTPCHLTICRRRRDCISTVGGPTCRRTSSLEVAALVDQ